MDGKTERAIRLVLQMLCSFVHCQSTDWLQFLPLIELHYNILEQESTGKALAYIVFGRQLHLPADFVAKGQPTA